MTFPTEEQAKATVDKLFMDMLEEVGHQIRRYQVSDYVHHIAESEKELTVDQLISWALEEGLIIP